MGFATKRLFGLHFLLAIALLTNCVQANLNADDATQSLLLTGATIHTMDGKPAMIGSILIVDGKVKAVGKIDKAKDAKVIDLTGYHVTPGLIESRGKLWLTSAAVAERNTKAELNVVDGIDPWSDDWKELAAQGITAVYVQPASTGSLGGYGAVMKVGPFSTPNDIVLKSQAGLQASLGITGATSKDRFAQFKALEKLLESASQELKKRTADKPPTPRKKDTPKGEADKQGKPAKDKPGAASPPSKQDDKKKEEDKSKSKAEAKKPTKENPTQEALIRVLKKEIPLHVEVHHSDALAHVMKLVSKYKFRCVLDGLSHVGAKSEQLQNSALPMVVGPFIEFGTPPAYRKSVDREWLQESLNQSGQPWAISGFPSSARASRLIRQQAAHAVRQGVDLGEALAALTIHPARMLGIGKLVGSIEVGKRADLAVFAGHPIDASSPVRMTLCGGQITYQNDAAKLLATLSKSVSQPDTPQKLPTSLPDAYVVTSTRVLHSDGQFKTAMIRVSKGTAKIVKKSDDAIPLYDLGDQYITTGLVNGHTTLGQTAVLTDPTESDSSHLRAADAVSTDTEQARKMLQGGFVHAGVSPGVTNTSAGLLGHIRLGANDPIANATAAGQIVLGSSARNNNRYPASLGGQVQMLNRLFAGKTMPTSLYVNQALASAMQQAKQAELGQLKDGKRPSILIANSDAELSSTMQLVKSQKLTGAIASTGRLVPWIKELKAAKLGVIVPQFSGSEYQERLQQYVKLDEAGIPLVLAGESAEAIRTTASLLRSAGVAEQSLLKALTQGGADLLGFANIGLKKNNSKADFVVWDGNPIDVSSQPQCIIVDGQRIASE